MTHSSLFPPHATEYEQELLNQIDKLTEVMEAAVKANDGESFLDALDESLSCEKRLAESREKTWAIWSADVQGFEVAA